MTCHEFRQAALALTLRELLRAQDEQVRQHAGDCRPCGDWLQGQRELVSGLQTLHHQTAGLEAGPHVERALLEAFGRDLAEGCGQRRRSRSTPVALRLSRFFEIGAYAAVAAAIVVGLFLGFRIWQDSAKINHAANESSSPAICGAGAAEREFGAGRRFRRSVNQPCKRLRPQSCRARQGRCIDFHPPARMRPAWVRLRKRRPAWMRTTSP